MYLWGLSINSDMIKHSAITLYIISCILAGGTAFAQSVSVADGIGKGYGFKEDMKTYEIIYREHGKEYADYYRTVRERIVERLRHNYCYNFRDGDVDLLFVLNSNGTIRRINVDLDASTDKKKLIDVAVLSLQQASPFPPFPDELPYRDMPFELTISFKKR